MMSIDIPYLPPQEVPVLVAQAASMAAGLPQPDYLVRDCTVTEHTDIKESAVRSVDPAGGVRNYMEDMRGKPLDITEFKPTLLQGPSHGTLSYLVENSGHMAYAYDPAPGYLGKDRAVFMVEYRGQYFKVVTEIQVVGTVVNDETCPPNRVIKLRKPSRGDAGESESATKLAFADLPNSELGSTTGTTITLDLNAAGHGWFIDATPTDNAEFLPTSSPNEWIAKEGSEAYGKMDLLTVLLHEYGHALGLEHSTDAHDYMATTLLPGVRRTLTVDEQLALMQLAGFFPTPDSPSTPYGPTDPGAPLPFTRVLSNARNARLRREEGLDALVPQFDTVANPKLTNPEFAGAQGWATTGDVAFANGAATLTETAAMQTRLNQVFVLGENDRFLSFTLANSALGDQANGPDDAFEVALVDASTGLSLMGGTGLTHNDAIVNRQTDGSEYKAAGINVVNNTDGSRTYLVDLAGIPAGTVVNLAFDLIGFGSGAAATNSHLTIRDLRLGVPQTTDDAATLAEDSPATIDALANDLNARQPGFTPEVISGPAHGQVAIDAEGRFTYTPEANWNGTDSFTYKISDRK